MSWGVSACGPAAQIAEQLDQQFETIKMNEPGEQETVNNIRALIAQTLKTIEPTKCVNVTASGSMGYRKWSSQAATVPHEGPYQSVDLKIAPIHFTV